MTELNGPYGPHLKVVCRPAPGASCDICIDVRDNTQPEGWREVWSINDSLPNALLQATVQARKYRQALLEGERV